MPIRPAPILQTVPPELAEGLERLRTELGVPDGFPPEVTAAAERAAAAPRLPQTDRTDLEFVTIDPPGSMDLDQALFIERDGSGYLVWYAIADVAAFVDPGGPIDAEAHRRGQTFYAPHQRTALHPPELSEDAASLLEDQVRPAQLWRLPVDERGQCTEPSVQRALVRSRARLTYEQVQAQLDDGTAGESLQLLKEVGLLREQVERERGGVSLNIPEQEVHVADDGSWVLAFRSTLPVEGWNAQISLLTGMAAAQLMLAAKIGIVRTLPPADEGSLRKLRTTARALGIDWPAEMDYPEFVRSLDPSRSRDAAMMYACTTLFRGAGYAAFNGTVPEQAQHAALAIEYAHCTAPLRRLIDRYTGEICVAISAGEPVPEWVTSELDGLPETMAASDRRAKQYERGIVDLTEALVLSTRVGEQFTGTVVSIDEDGSKGRLVVADPAVEANVTGKQLPLGEQVTATLVKADVAKGEVRFEVGPGEAAQSA
ncbi:ribonuclease II [Enemella evansiae]|uniref:RNB domain-containing ribonuclease n=1 Tax=Enemella evansiae TaxID=2016499 RepID=UPI000B95D2DE|nr:RNB domain-containing ribonuclease [Enemella evansiae]OYN95721.1 ribonuclease II [Enemella evansiae]